MRLLRLRPLYGVLTEAEARRMLDPRIPTDPETWLILNLTLRCGLAGHEMAWLRRDDVNLRRGTALVRDVRGSPHHEVVLHPEAGKALRQYLDRFRDRYSKSPTPSSRYRLAQPRRVRSEIPKTRQMSAVRTLSSRYCLTTRSLNCTPASTMDWPRRGGRMC